MKRRHARVAYFAVLLSVLVAWLFAVASCTVPLTPEPDVRIVGMRDLGEPLPDWERYWDTITDCTETAAAYGEVTWKRADHISLTRSHPEYQGQAQRRGFAFLRAQRVVLTDDAPWTTVWHELNHIACQCQHGPEFDRCDWTAFIEWRAA